MPFGIGGGGRSGRAGCVSSYESLSVSVSLPNSVAAMGAVSRDAGGIVVRNVPGGGAVRCAEDCLESGGGLDGRGGGCVEVPALPEAAAKV